MQYIGLLRKICNNYLLSLFLLIIAFFLRFYDFNKLGFWGDEYLTFWLTEPLLTLGEITEKTLSSPDFVPPFYYYILNLYNYYFEYSAYFLRLFHIIFGSSSLIITFLISKLLLNKSGSNLVLYLLAFNLFLVWSSTEVRVVSFVLFFQLFSIYIFLMCIKNLQNNYNYINSFFLFIINLLILTIHPLSVVIVASQFLFILILIIFKKYVSKGKNFYIHLSSILLAMILYVILNNSYIFSSIETTRLDNHNQLNLNFFLGYNFKHYFSSYILGFLNLLLIIFTFISCRKKFFQNINLLFLFIILILTYLFIIFGTIFLTGINGQRYWSYLVPLITIINIYYLTKIKTNTLSKIIIFFIIFYTPYIFFKNINYPQVKKPNTPELIKVIKSSNTKNVVSENYSMFENYLKKAYKDFEVILINENEIKKITKDFWYLCLDLSWHQNKGSYWNEMYDCSPKKKNTLKFIKSKSIRLQGYVITKYEIK